MHHLHSKTPAKIALGITAVSFALLILAFVIDAIDPPNPDAAHSRGFAYWVYSYIVALFSIPFYWVDMSRSRKKAKLDIDKCFNNFLFWVILISIPVFVVFGGSFAIAWNMYYLFLFIVETVSVVRSSRVNTIH